MPRRVCTERWLRVPGCKPPAHALCRFYPAQWMQIACILLALYPVYGSVHMCVGHDVKCPALEANNALGLSQASRSHCLAAQPIRCVNAGCEACTCLPNESHQSCPFCGTSGLTVLQVKTLNEVDLLHSDMQAKVAHVHTYVQRLLERLRSAEDEVAHLKQVINLAKLGSNEESEHARAVRALLDI